MTRPVLTRPTLAAACMEQSDPMFFQGVHALREFDALKTYFRRAAIADARGWRIRHFDGRGFWDWETGRAWKRRMRSPGRHP